MTRPAGRMTIVPAAYEHYVKGRGASRSRTAAGLRAAVRQFQEAIRLDASFAPARAALATAYVLLASGPTSAPDGLPDLERARDAAKRAIELDPDLPEAHAVLAAVAQRLDWDWAAADAGYRRAIRVSPGDSLAREWYAGFLAEQGRHREALAEAEFTVELDPLLADAHALLGFVHYHARRFDRAAAAARRALELRSAHVPARLILAWSLLESGDPAGAIAACEAQSWRDGLDEMLATLADAHLRRGASARADEVQRELLALEAPSPSALVRLHVSRGELDAAFGLLGRALDRKWTMGRTLRVDPLFARLRRDPRYAGLMGRLTQGGGQ
jgi:tetratricopeptide (TPR) repeat protein